ncbi:MAG: HAD family phosphatase [Methylovulum sp.]|uniref:HAD family hydrolase n=1 Tax=Methylovulum sp. TaxID=1916980 RepID=UPI0026263657|nr:HAD family phosphatase [Methylovulum sp.]MDD2725541.1 HAD family phosphatase [Methylovulum sp.]MDD5125816.1 HAD family phosphatase [Methylovulum sp.]
MFPNCPAIIFDLDGLVLDTETTYIFAWRQAAQAMGYALSESFCQSFSGLHGQAVEAKLLAALGADFDLQTFKQQAGECWRDYVNVHGIPVKPGVLEILDYLDQQAIPFALATNSRAINARECLALAGLGHAFPLQVTRDDVTAGKPAPDIFLQAAKLLQTPIGRCWVLEDSLTGIVAAHHAGAFSVLVPSVIPAEAQALELCGKLLPDLHAVLAMIRINDTF